VSRTTFFDLRVRFGTSLTGDRRGLAEITTILILLVFAVLISGVVIAFVSGLVDLRPPPQNVVLDASIDAGAATLVLVHESGEALNIGACYITLFDEDNTVQVGVANTTGQGAIRAGSATGPISIALNPGHGLVPLAKYLVKVYWAGSDQQIALISTVAR